MPALAINGIEHISFKHGYNLLICNTEFSPKKERAYLDILIEKQVDGVMIAPCSDGGYLRALREVSIPFDEERVLFRHPSSHGGYEAMEEIMGSGERPDGIYVTSCTLAAGMLQYCRDKRLRIPRDFQAACFDSFGEFDDLIRPSLTCNEAPAESLT